MKKAYALYELLGNNRAAASLQEIIAEIIIVLGYLAYIFWQDETGSYPDYLILFLCLRFADSARSIRGPQVRALPVTDRYLLNTYLFLWPAIVIGICGLVAAGLVLCDPITGNEDNWFWYGLRYAFTDAGGLWAGLIFAFGFLLLCKSGQFSMDYRKRTAGIIINGALYFIIPLVYWKMVPGKWVTFGLSCLWFLAAALIAYVRGMRFLRYDVKSQKLYDLKQEVSAWNKGITGEKTGNCSNLWIAAVVIALVVGVSVFAVLMATGIFDSGTEFDYTYTEASQYDEWGNIPELQEHDDLIFDGDTYQIIFPDEIDDSQAEYYYSWTTGEVGDGWSSIYCERYLKISYTEQQYTAEKQRVSGLTVTADKEDCKDEYYYGTSQSMIHDTEHFPFETYIASWDIDTDEYEYAMFDDSENTVYYVYFWGMELDPKMGEDTLFDGNTHLVISQDEQNDGNGNYSIYTFGDGIKALVSP